MKKIFIVFQLMKCMLARTALTEPNELNNENKELISHGEFFDIQKYPFMVYFKYTKSDGYVGMCTGSLILPLFVLTAAHCTNKVDKYDLVVTNFSNVIQYCRAIYIYLLLQYTYTFFTFITSYYNSPSFLLF